MAELNKSAFNLSRIGSDGIKPLARRMTRLSDDALKKIIEAEPPVEKDLHHRLSVMVNSIIEGLRNEGMPPEHPAFKGLLDSKRQIGSGEAVKVMQENRFSRLLAAIQARAMKLDMKKKGEAMEKEAALIQARAMKLDMKKKGEAMEKEAALKLAGMMKKQAVVKKAQLALLTTAAKNPGLFQKIIGRLAGIGGRVRSGGKRYVQLLRGGDREIVGGYKNAISRLQKLMGDAMTQKNTRAYDYYKNLIADLTVGARNPKMNSVVSRLPGFTQAKRIDLANELIKSDLTRAGTAVGGGFVGTKAVGSVLGGGNKAPKMEKPGEAKTVKKAAERKVDEKDISKLMLLLSGLTDKGKEALRKNTRNINRSSYIGVPKAQLQLRDTFGDPEVVARLKMKDSGLPGTALWRLFESSRHVSRRIAKDYDKMFNQVQAERKGQADMLRPLAKRYKQTDSIVDILNNKTASVKQVDSLIKKAGLREKFVKRLMEQLLSTKRVRRGGIAGMLGKTKEVPNLSGNDFHSMLKRREGVLRATGRWSDDFTFEPASKSQKNVLALKAIEQMLARLSSYHGVKNLGDVELLATSRGSSSGIDARNILRAAKRGQLPF